MVCDHSGCSLCIALTRQAERVCHCDAASLVAGSRVSPRKRSCLIESTHRSNKDEHQATFPHGDTDRTVAGSHGVYFASATQYPLCWGSTSNECRDCRPDTKPN